jgi:flagellar hook-associated protein 2
MIDNNIIQSIGAGSGIDTNNLVKQLTEIERAAPQARIDSRRDLTKTQISDYGLLSSALATLKDAASKLSDPEGMFSKSASYTQSESLVPTDLSTDVQAGTYTFTVEKIAQSQSLSSTVFSDTGLSIGEGTLTFSFGNVTASGGAMTAFAADADADDVEIVIDSSNNTLEGLRDAINTADFGVQATIVNNGSGYILQLNAASGADNELRITVDDDDGDDDDDSGLSQFAFNTTVSNLTHQQDGEDAELTINGLTVYRESNTIDDIVEGLSLDVRSADPGEKITITVTDDKDFAEQNIRDFVTAYNEFLKAIKPATGIYEKEDEEGNVQTLTGSLANDSLSRSIISQIRNVISSAVPGLTDSNFTSLGAIGIRTQLDGTMSINEETFEKAFKNNFSDIQKLFAPSTYTSDSSIYINSYNTSTKAGAYEVTIDVAPSRGYYEGNTLGIDVDNVFPNYNTSGSTYTFKIEVNGTESDTITIPTGTYSSIDDFVEAMQAAINADENLEEDGYEVVVSYDSAADKFVITSTRYGDSSEVNITEAHSDTITNLGLAVASGVQGQTVEGSIDGVEGFGSANVLLPKLGEPGTGMALVVADGATSGTVNFSRGFAGELEAILNQFLVNNGLIDQREATLTKNLTGIKDEEAALDRRMTAYQERLIQQFIAMERILASLSTSGSFLDNLINTLPFTASKNK